MAVALWRAEKRPTHDLAPFLLSLSLFVLGYLGLVLGMWPYLLPGIDDLGCSSASVVAWLQPGRLGGHASCHLGYTARSYRVFRGKVSASTSYH